MQTHPPASFSRGEVTALKPVRAEQVKRPERKQNRTVPHCGSVLPIRLSLRPVGPIHIIIETVLIICCSPRADIGGPNCRSITRLIIWNIFYSFFWHYLSILFLIFSTEAAQYECSYRRTAHHATVVQCTVFWHFPHSMQCRVYVTDVSVCPSVCLSGRSTSAAVAAAWARAADMSIDSCRRPSCGCG